MRSLAKRRTARTWIVGAAAFCLLAVATFLVFSPDNWSGLRLQSCSVGGQSARCGQFRTPENPGEPGGKKIKLNVAVVKATGSHPKPDPLMWLSGWGGAGVSDDMNAVLPALRAVNVDRDLIFIDQRGTGSSKLVCTMPAGWDKRTATPAATTAAARKCAASIGPNFRYYTSAVAVDDFDHIRQALRYEKVNLYGGSYGVTTGLIYLLRHERHVRSAAFDSGSLLDVHIFERAAAAGQRALDLVFRRCAGDTACATAYPNLRREFNDLLARLATHPIHVAGASVALDDIAFAGAVEDMTTGATGKAMLPRLIDLVYKGKIDQARRAFPSVGSAPHNTELAYKLMIQCSEPWASWRLGQVERLSKDSYLAPVQMMNAKGMASVCKAMPRGVAPAAIGKRVHSTVPVLFLTGNEDPADPPANVANANRELPNSRTVIFPNSGHGQLNLLCAQNLIRDFVARGSAKGLDTSCAATAVRTIFDIRS